MRIRNARTGAEFAVQLTTEHSASRDGQHVVVVDSVALEPPGFEVIECTEREVDKLPRPWVHALLDAVYSAHSTP